MRRCLLLLMIVWLASCVNPNEKSVPRKFQNIDFDKIGTDSMEPFHLLPGEPEIIKIPNDLNQGFRTSDVIDSTWFIKLQTGTDFVVGELTKLEVHDDKLFLFDFKSKAIFIFYDDGRFFRKIRPIGQGPGEFVYPIDFNVDKERNEIVVYENKLAKVLYFSLDGTFLREKQVGFRFSHFFPLTDGFLVHTDKNYNAHLDEIQNFKLVKVDSSWNFLNRGFPYSFERQGDFNFTNVVPFQQVGSEIVFIPPFKDTIFSISNNQLTPKYVIDAGTRRLPPDFDVDLTFDQFFKRYDNNQYIYFMGEAKEGPEFLYFNGRFDRKVLYAFYSKKSKKLFCSTVMETIIPPPFVVPITITGNVLISKMDAHFFASNRKELMNSNFNERDKVLLGSLNENDNPVLIFYRVRPF